MKRFLLGIALLACLPVFAQDQRNSVLNNSFYVYKVKGDYLIRAFDAQVTETSSNVEFVDRTATSCLLRLTGNVEVTTQDGVLQADQAVGEKWQLSRILTCYLNLPGVHSHPIRRGRKEIFCGVVRKLSQ